MNYAGAKDGGEARAISHDRQTGELHHLGYFMARDDWLAEGRYTA